MTMALRVMGLAPGLGREVARLAALLLGVMATYVGQGVLVAAMLELVFSRDGAGSLFWPAVSFAVLSVVRAVLNTRRELAGLRVAHRAKSALRVRLSDQLFDLGPGWLQRSRAGTVQSTAVEGVEAVEPYVSRFLPQLLASTAGATTLALVIVVLDPLVGGIVLLCAALTPVVPVISGRLMDRRVQVWWASYHRLYADNLDALQGMSTLKAFNASRRRGEQLALGAQQFCADSIRVLAWWGAYLAVVGLAGVGGTAVAVGLGAVHRVEGSLTTTELLLILMLARECFRPLRDLETAFHAAGSFRAISTGLFELLDACADVVDPASPHTLRPTSAPEVRFENVSFSYPGRPSPVLEHFTLTVAPAERVAIVGRSGAGKSTLLTLLLRYFDVDSGRITVDGLDVRDLALADLRARIAVVSQDTYLFHGTVRANLQLAAPEATEAELIAAATAARAHDFIEALPQGYDTLVGERGVRLSGGERQRIAIARALLVDAPILVLDEATSNLDAANEAAIVSGLEELTRGRTTIVIAHRLSTVRHADRLVVLDRGNLAEMGTHTELVADQGAYAQLIAAQEVKA